MRNWLIKKLGGYIRHSEPATVSRPKEEPIPAHLPDYATLTKYYKETQEALRLVLSCRSSGDYHRGYSDGIDARKSQYDAMAKRLADLENWRSRLMDLGKNTHGPLHP